MAKVPGGTAAIAALTRADVWFAVHSYRHDPRVSSYGQEAAAAMGVAAERVLKTLMVSYGGELAVGMVPVAGQLDLKAFARALGGGKAVMAEISQAERATGYVVGAISPIGQRRRHATVLDASALRHETVFVSGGRRGIDLEIHPADLVAITQAITAEIGRP
jgi:Cys-tRNA(Pro)/Cys-tRNA(Cys) deacylase